MGRYRIVSFDGGPGSLAAVRHLRARERRCPGFLAKTDCFVGTSAGAAIALFIAKRMRPKGEALSDEEALSILDCAVDFADSFYKAFEVGLVNLALSITPLVLVRPLLGEAKVLRDLVQKEFGDLRLCDLDRHVVAVSFRMSREEEGGRIGEPYVVAYTNREQDYFEGLDHPFLRSIPETLVSEVALRSAAVPAVTPHPDGHVDGFVAANNPAFLGVAAELLANPTNPARAFEIVVASFGAEQTRRYRAANEPVWR